MQSKIIEIKNIMSAVKKKKAKLTLKEIQNVCELIVTLMSTLGRSDFSCCIV